MSEELTRAALREFPLPPVADAGKNERGRLLVLAGSRQVPGSAILCTMAALRSGAGKVRVATAQSIAAALAVQLAEAFVMGLEEDSDGGCTPAAAQSVAEQARKADSVVAGPGMQRGEGCGRVAGALLKADVPLVLDAAILHVLRDFAEGCRKARVPPVLLPHSGEMAALLGCDQEEAEADPLACAKEAAAHYRAYVLAKGSTSHVAAPDGRCWTYRGGAPGLGIAGSGDTLAGIVGAQAARGAEPLTTLLWGVLLHGEAGEALSRKVGPIGFLAREIPDELPALLAR